MISRSKQHLLIYFQINQVLLVLFLCSCMTRQPESIFGLNKNLVDYYYTASITGGKQEILFQDPITIKKHCKAGWYFRDIEEKSIYPWPCFHGEQGIVTMEWNRRVDRRISVKLLNIKPSYPEDLLEIRVNNELTVALPRKGNTSTFDFFSPATQQNTGLNTISIKLNIDYPDKPQDNSLIALHSLVFTQGAAIKTPAAIGKIIKPSILLAAPISISFNYDPRIYHYLEFKYGFAGASEDSPQTYNLKIDVTENNSGKTIREIELSVGSSLQKWRHQDLDLPELRDDNAVLTFHFEADHTQTANGDYLALSDIYLKPSKTSQNTAIPDKPDILIITPSGYGSNLYSAYGNSLSLTPNADRVFRDGIQYASCFTTCNANPAILISSMTGLFLRDHHNYQNYTLSDSPNHTIPDNLKEAGYSCKVIVQSSQDIQSVFSKINGIDEILFETGSGLGLKTLCNLYTQIAGDGNLVNEPIATWVHLQALTETGIPKSEIFSDQDFGADEIDLGSLNLPHKDTTRLEQQLRDRKDLRSLFSQEYRSLYALDKAIAKLKHIHSDQRPERRLVILITGDHGSYQTLGTPLFSNDSLNNQIISIPMGFQSISTQEIQCRRLSSQSISNMDLPLIVQFLHKTPPEKLLNSIDNIPFTSQKMIFSEHASRRIVAVIKENWKYIHCFSEPYFRLSSSNLFNLNDDPDEDLNLAGQESAILTEMTTIVTTFCKNGNFYPLDEEGISSEGINLLKSLNYVK